MEGKRGIDRYKEDGEIGDAVFRGIRLGQIYK